MTIQCSDNFYRLILKNTKSDIALQINAFTIGKSGISSLLDSQFFNSGATISVIILGSKDNSKTRQLTLKHKDFDILIEQYVKTGTLPTFSQSANGTNPPSSTSTTNHTTKHPYAGYIPANAQFVHEININVLDGIFSLPDIEALVLHSKSINFAEIFTSISNTIKEALTTNKKVDESQLESEAKKVFLYLIIKQKVSTIKELSTKEQKKENLEVIQSLIMESLAEYQSGIVEYKEKIPQLIKRRQKKIEMKGLIYQRNQRNFLLKLIQDSLSSSPDQEQQSEPKEALTEQTRKGHDSI